MATDSHGRRIDYLRISLTDRCNLRCVYCMPAEGVQWKDPAEILSYDEIVRFARIAVGEGIGKIRLTGGEPLVRRGAPDLVRRLHEIEGVQNLALTTNATLLPRFAAELRDAGLERINVSLDSLDPAEFAAITRGGKLVDALAGLDAAFETGFSPVKLNVVVVRSLKQDLLGFAKMSLGRPLHVRFIEYMPLGDAEEGSGCHSDGSAAWTAADSVPSEEVIDLISSKGEAAGFGELLMVPSDKAPGGSGPARYYRFAEAQGTVGVISPLSHHFCADCNRLRLTADGRLRPCLFCDDELDVRTVLRAGTDEDVRAVIREALRVKPENHAERIGTDRQMSQIGG
jgi:GTP 3',8-cyclase